MVDSENGLLDSLLCAAASELEKLSQEKTTKPSPKLQETNIFENELTPDEGNSSVNAKCVTSSSLINTGDTDSSDDEDNRYPQNSKYNTSGRDIKHLLQTSHTSSKHLGQCTSSTWKDKSEGKPIKNTLQEKKTETNKVDVYTDPVFGLRIVNPLISSQMLKERMVGREAVSFSRIAQHIKNKKEKCDWVIAGVVVSKAPVKTSQKGQPFSIWTLSDLRDDIKTVTLFLFSSAHKQLWKTAVGTVIGILNPNVLDKKDYSKDEASLSVDNAQKLMIFGRSKDFGICKSTKKNGEKCTAIVNVNRCEFCVYHIKQEYQKCSRRSELQANFAGRGLTALRNKVLGKNEVFYAGKSFMAIPAKKNGKLQKNDQKRLQSLNGVSINSNNIVKAKNLQKKGSVANNLEVSQAQRMRDIELLKKLAGNTSMTLNSEGEQKCEENVEAKQSYTISLEESRANALEVIAKLKEKDLTRSNLKPNTALTTTPKLSGSSNQLIDLSKPIAYRRVDKAKLNAVKYIQLNGPIKKIDPNDVKSSKDNKPALELDDITYSIAKKPKISESEFISDRFKRMMAATSKHQDLLEQHDNEEQNKYFNKLEMKERMEDKMINTYKVPCKAVRCTQCKYTSFSASESCKMNKHPLKVFDAFKRFFKCGSCGNRTISLDVVPLVACKNCGSGKWERTGMMNEKTVTVGHNLSIRGGEQTFVNSVAADANINLLVPDD